ncbi:MAG: hypothetical protein LW724_20510 [Planctomycetaceae bacterium]|nr:hypothetical protein [Planctomycetaceae bacterium]
MTPDIAQLLREWDRDVLNGPTSYVGEGEFIDFLATQLFDSFEPAAGAQHPEFGSRLRDWLSCEQDEHYKQKMVQLASRILFFGAKEFEALYRATLPRSVYPWLVNELGLMLDSPNLDAQLQNGIRTTWFTGVTESMRLATFYHVNNIEGVDWRLDWHGAIKGNVSIGRLEEYMAKHGLTRVVVLEDFAGSGTQIREAADLFCQLGKSIPILVAPFFACLHPTS